ncbi:hypothetical protein GCM10025331_62870 [Actinoplanes utahensis]|nr:hypothetical protein Aut01nite_71410 [Actinoplanes utahensis]
MGGEGAGGVPVGGAEHAEFGPAAGAGEEVQVPQVAVVPEGVGAVALRVWCDERDRPVPVAVLLGGDRFVIPLVRLVGHRCLAASRRERGDRRSAWAVRNVRTAPGSVRA